MSPVRLTTRPISVEKVIKSVANPAAGATATFIGTVRNRSGGSSISMLEFEAAPDLALKDLERITARAENRFDIIDVAITHRLGRLKVGDVIIVIAASAPHRKDAFKACEYIIDELKKTTPIWKKEHGRRGARWVLKGDMT